MGLHSGRAAMALYRDSLTCRNQGSDSFRDQGGISLALWVCVGSSRLDDLWIAFEAIFPFFLKNDTPILITINLWSCPVESQKSDGFHSFCSVFFVPVVAAGIFLTYVIPSLPLVC